MIIKWVNSLDLQGQVTTDHSKLSMQIIIANSKLSQNNFSTILKSTSYR